MLSNPATSQIVFLRRAHSSKLNILAPISDLSAISKDSSDAQATQVPGQKNDAAITGGQILGDEYAEHVVKVSHSIFFTNLHD